MNRQEWIERCSARLRQQWPRVPAEQLREVAGDIATAAQAPPSDPELAAVEWLRQAIPDHAQRHAG